MDAANLRSAYAEVLSEVMLGTPGAQRTVTQKQKTADWSDTTFTSQWPSNFTVEPPTSASGSWTVTATVEGQVTAAYTGS